MLDQHPERIARMFDAIAPRYDALNRLISLGQDKRWRRHLLAHLPAPRQGTLCDVACGTGDVVLLAREGREAWGRIVGVDLSEGMLDVARRRLARVAARGGCDVTWHQASALELPLEDASVDAITIAFGIRNIQPRSGALAEFHRVLKPGGHLGVLEIVAPEKGLSGRLFDFYFQKVMPAVASRFSNSEAYHYLPASVAAMPTATSFQREVCAAGFSADHARVWFPGTVGCFVFRKEFS